MGNTIGFIVYVVVIVLLANLVSWSFDMPLDRVYILMILGNLLQNEWKKLDNE